MAYKYGCKHTYLYCHISQYKLPIQIKTRDAKDEKNDLRAFSGRAYNFGSASNGNTSNVGTRWRTPTFRALASDRRVLPLDKGTSKPPSPVVPASGVIGTGAVISVPFRKNFSIHEICIENSKS